MSNLDYYRRRIAELEQIPLDYMSEYAPRDNSQEGITYKYGTPREEILLSTEVRIHENALIRYVTKVLQPHKEYFAYMRFQLAPLIMTKNNLLIGSFFLSNKSDGASVWFHIHTKYTNLDELNSILYKLAEVDAYMDKTPEKGRLTQFEIDGLIDCGFYDVTGQNNTFKRDNLEVHFYDNGVTLHKRVALSIIKAFKVKNALNYSN